MKKITVSQYAKMCGESKSAIYSRLDGDLKPFVFEEGGIKYIDVDAIESTDKPQEKEPDAESEEIKALKARIAELEAQLAVARESNDAKENRLLDMLDRVIEATNANQILTRNNQELQAKLIETQKLLALPEPQQKKGLLSRIFSRK